MYTGPVQLLNYPADTLHCLDDGRDKSCMNNDIRVCVCAFTPGVMLGAIILSPALFLTPDLLERYSVRVLNMSRPLTDPWGQKKRVSCRTSLTEIYEWKDVLDIARRDSVSVVLDKYQGNEWMLFLITLKRYSEMSIFFHLIVITHSQKTLNEAVLIGLKPKQFNSIWNTTPPAHREKFKSVNDEKLIKCSFSSTKLICIGPKYWMQMRWTKSKNT